MDQTLTGQSFAQQAGYLGDEIQAADEKFEKESAAILASLAADLAEGEMGMIEAEIDLETKEREFALAVEDAANQLGE